MQLFLGPQFPRMHYIKEFKAWIRMTLEHRQQHIAWPACCDNQHILLP